jgi:hypothetical protein
LDTEDNWFVGAGAGVNLGDSIHIEGAIGKGEGYDDATYVDGISWVENDYEFWVANAFLDFKFGDGMKIQLSWSYADTDHEFDEFVDVGSENSYYDAVNVAQSFGATLFWDPVRELTLGLGAGYRTKEDSDGTEREEIIGGFGAWFRFY